MYTIYKAALSQQRITVCYYNYITDVAINEFHYKTIYDAIYHMKNN